MFMCLNSLMAWSTVLYSSTAAVCSSLLFLYSSVPLSLLLSLRLTSVFISCLVSPFPLASVRCVCERERLYLSSVHLCKHSGVSSTLNTHTSVLHNFSTQAHIQCTDWHSTMLIVIFLHYLYGMHNMFCMH